MTIISSELQNGMSALHMAVQFKNMEIIGLLLQCEKIDINLSSPLFGTPLHLACANDSIKIV